MSEKNYTVVLFSSVKTNDLEGYQEMNDKLMEEVKSQPGFIDVRSYSDGKEDMTIVRFENDEAALQWKNRTEHLKAQDIGRKQWYEYYRVEVGTVYRAYEFKK